MKSNSSRFLRSWRSRPRLFLCVMAGIVVAILIPQSLVASQLTRIIIGWNTTTCLYLVLGGFVMLRATHEQIKARAKLQDEGGRLILLLVILASVASLMGSLSELMDAKIATEGARAGHIALAALTILSSWGFTHMMFALHYAHDYYLACVDGNPPGLEFPGKEMPDYGDFLYFAFVIGTSAQTADVNLTTRSMRRIGLVHYVLSFLFNTTVLALTINIAATLV